MKIRISGRLAEIHAGMLACLLLSASIVLAHDGEGHQHSDSGTVHVDPHAHEHSIESKLTVEEITSNISSSENELSKAISEKRLGDVHRIAFKIRDLAFMLPNKVAEERRTRVEGTVGNIARIATELDNSGDAGDQARTESNAKKLNAVLKLLKSQID